jgi:hypothetical protein
VKGALYAGLSLAFAIAGGAAALEMKPPHLSHAQVDWAAAVATLGGDHALRPIAPNSLRSGKGGTRSVRSALGRLNAIMSQRFPGIATSPVPVLLPFDVEALRRDQAAGTASEDNEQYQSGFRDAHFFYPGPAGYDAAFAIRTSEIPELADIKFTEPIEVQISGSALLYELDTPVLPDGSPVAALEADFPGIRKLILERNLRYTFVRFGVPYVVSITCFDAGIARFRLPSCRVAERVAMRFLRALHVVGGTPQRHRLANAQPIERPAELSDSFAYHAPGRILPGTGFRAEGGRADHTVYAQIRFPLAKAPAYANSLLFARRKGRSAVHHEEPAGPSYAWRDNFCERRGFPVAQCPAGLGHQGQDIRPAPCETQPGAERCERHDDVVAVRGGIILRSPRQEAAYLFVNSAIEHLRFRYLHMNPRKMNADNLLSGRRVHEGEVIGQVSNFSKKENGTSYHLHFDIQVPTKHGWVYVNPYMTLVAAYERLIGARGIRIGDPTRITSTNPTVAGPLSDATRLEPPIVKPSRANSNGLHNKRHRHRLVRH